MLEAGLRIKRFTRLMILVDGGSKPYGSSTQKGALASLQNGKELEKELAGTEGMCSKWETRD